MAERRKRLTQREKAGRAAAKKRLQEQGVLPPDKPRLNRKKFAQETWTEYEALCEADPIRAELALIKAICFMVGPNMASVSPEEVGVLKVLKMAIEYDAFLKRLEKEGRGTYTMKEIIEEVFLPVYKL